MNVFCKQLQNVGTLGVRRLLGSCLYFSSNILASNLISGQFVSTSVSVSKILHNSGGLALRLKSLPKLLVCRS